MMWSLVLMVLVGSTGSKSSRCETGTEIKEKVITSQSSDYSGDPCLVHTSTSAANGSNVDGCNKPIRWLRIDLPGVYSISCVRIVTIQSTGSENSAEIYIRNSKEKDCTVEDNHEDIKLSTDGKNDIPFEEDVSGSYITVFFGKETCLSLDELKIFGTVKGSTASKPSSCKTGTEIKVKGITSQSSDSCHGVEHDSNKAVDGSNDTCSRTNKSIGNWWRIDLQGVYTELCVQIFNKLGPGCDLTCAEIYIGNSKEKDCTVNHKCKEKIRFSCNEQNVYTFSGGVSGRYITVVFPEETHLVLCEVKIFGTVKESPFELIRENKTWPDALDHCRDNNKYETLVSIVDEDTQTWAELEADNSSTPFVWVGLRYTCCLDFWFWVEDLVVQFTRWAPRGKIEECNRSGAIEKGGNYLWYAEPGDTKLNFICKKKNPS